MMKLGKFTSLLTLSFLLLFGHSNAQNQDETPNRLSIGVFGTLTKGHLNVGSTFQSAVNANFEFKEQFNNTIGFNIRYVATPEVALQANIGYGKFTLLSEFENQQSFLSLENQYWTSSLSTQLSLLRLFGGNSQNFNIYGSIGTGLMFNNISVESEGPNNNIPNATSADHPGQTFFTSIGGGIRFNLGPRIDSFAQYEFNVANRDIVDGDYLGELYDLSGSAKTSNTWSVISVGIQFKFGSSDVDADWPTPLLPSGQPPYSGDDVFEELENRLLAQQEEQLAQIENLTNQIESLEEELESQQQLESRTVEINSDTLNTLITRIESLEKEIANEREKAELNLQKLDELTTQLDSLQTQLSAEQAARREQEQLYENNIADLQARIDSLVNELNRVQDGEQIGQAIDEAADVESETDPSEEDDASTTPIERRDDEDTEPETVGRKDVDSSTEIADTLATEEQQTTESPEGADEDASVDDTPDETEEPDIASKDPDETSDDTITDSDAIEEDDSVIEEEESITELEPESEVDEPEDSETAEEADTDEEGRSLSWLIYTLLALVVAVIVYFVSKIFSSKDDNNQSGGSGSDNNKGGGSPSPTSDTPDGGSTSTKSPDEVSPSYPVPEHSRTIKRKQSDSKASTKKNTGQTDTGPKSSEAIPEHSITVDPKSKKSKSDSNKSDFSSNQESQMKATKDSEKNRFASRGYIEMTISEISDYLSTLYSRKSGERI